MRWLPVAVLLLAVSCGSSDDGGERGYDELFDAALELYCPQPTQNDCRDTARANLSYLTAPAAGHDFSPEDVLAFMIDEMDADQFESFTDAATEAVRQLTSAE